MECKAIVRSNRKVCGDFFHMILGVPDRYAAAEPGQFVHVRVGNGTDPLIRRPFSIYRIGRDRAGLTAELLYRKIGRATTLMTQARTGESLSLEGPLGNGFRVDRSASTHLLVAGGYGVAPLRFVAERLLDGKRRPDVHVLVGARNKAQLLCIDELRGLGATVHTATDDGSAGFHGTVADYFKELIGGSAFRANRTRVYACGPHAMMRALSDVCVPRHIDCQVSLEELMACGVGVCLTCVCRIRRPGAKGRNAWSFRRVCADGPVFSAKDVVF